MTQTPPPGWYPNPHRGGQTEYWDGSSFVAAPTTMPGFAPTPGAQPNWFMRHKVLSGVLALFVVGGIASAAGGGSEPQEDEQPAAASAGSTAAPEQKEQPAVDVEAKPGKAAAAPAEEEAEEVEVVAEEPQQTLQDRFLTVVVEGAQATEDADNEIGVVQARTQRGEALCDVLPKSLEVTMWSGTVKEVETELGGDDGVLAIDLGDGIAVGTWNNSLSDIGSDTLISPSSDMYAELATLSEGDEILFAGEFISDGDDCLEEQSLMDENGMLTPTFSFKFAGVLPN